MIALILAATIAHPSAQAQEARLQHELTVFAQHRAQIERETGPDQAVDMGMRLVGDDAYLTSPVPDGYSAADWKDTTDTLIDVDVNAIEDLSHGVRRTLSSGAGLYETFVPSRVDGTWQPVAVYVPAQHLPHPPIALLLHGRPQTETELLAQPYFRRLADRTGTVLVAPWGRGIYDYAGIGATDAFDELAEAQKAFGSDPQRVYLVGYSMGGFSVFKIGPLFKHWTAIMDVSGAMLNSEVPVVRFAWRDTPVYVVTGTEDASIPSIYAKETAQFLAFLGVPTGFYEQRGGAHQVRTLMPALTSAWSDMHAGVVRADSVPMANGSAPNLPKIVNQSVIMKP